MSWEMTRIFDDSVRTSISDSSSFTERSLFLLLRSSRQSSRIISSGAWEKQTQALDAAAVSTNTRRLKDVLSIALYGKPITELRSVTCHMVLAATQHT